MAVNYGLRGTAHHQALRLAPQLFGPTLPVPCGPLPSAAIDFGPGALRPRPPMVGRRCLVELAAVPTFFSPFRWRVIANLSNGYELHDIDLLDARFRAPARDLPGIWRTAVRFPDIWAPVVEQAARTPTAQLFLGFSRFPDARWFTDPRGTTTVRWMDVRFAGGLLRVDQPPQRRLPFAVTVKVGADGRILLEEIDP